VFHAVKEIEVMKCLALHRIASLLYFFIALSLHCFIASLLYRFIASSLYHFIASLLLLPSFV
jgi:hypothetical protein